MSRLRTTLIAALGTALLTPATSAQCFTPGLDGRVIAIDGPRAIVGTDLIGPTVEIQLLERQLSGWTPVDTLTTAGVSVFILPSVAIDGGRAIFGNAEASGAGIFQGRALVFEQVGGQWTSSELFSSNAADGDFFGGAVDVDGDYAVVGALHQCAVPTGFEGYQSRAHVFERVAGNWTEVAQLAPFGDGAGFAVALDGDTLAVGAPLDHTVTRLTSPGSIGTGSRSPVIPFISRLPRTGCFVVRVASLSVVAARPVFLSSRSISTLVRVWAFAAFVGGVSCSSS